MFYKCLKCGKVLKGLGLRPHMSYKHHMNMAKLESRQRKGYGWSRYHDYFYETEQEILMIKARLKLVAVCLGDDDLYSERSLKLWIEDLKKQETTTQ